VLGLSAALDREALIPALRCNYGTAPHTKLHRGFHCNPAAMQQLFFSSSFVGVLV